jgi:transcriptional regulator with XRE-family HTH domain
MIFTAFKRCRISKNLTQWDLARKVHINQSRLSLLETGQAPPSVEEKRILCKFFDQPPVVLFPNFFDISGFPKKPPIEDEINIESNE